MIRLTVGGEGCAGAAVRDRPAIAPAAVSVVAASTAARANNSRLLGTFVFPPAAPTADGRVDAGLPAFALMGILRLTLRT